VAKFLLLPGGFARAAWAEQKETAGRRLQKSLNHRHFCCRNGVSTAILLEPALGGIPSESW
jgi:hypothetical protein